MIYCTLKKENRKGFSELLTDEEECWMYSDKYRSILEGLVNGEEFECEIISMFHTKLINISNTFVKDIVFFDVKIT